MKPEKRFVVKPILWTRNAGLIRSIDRWCPLQVIVKIGEFVCSFGINSALRRNPVVVSLN